MCVCVCVCVCVWNPWLHTHTGPSSKDKAEDLLASLLGMRTDSNYVKDRSVRVPHTALGLF